MASEEMTSRERWLAFLKAEPVDRLPFWPKTSSVYLETRKKAGDAVAEPLPGAPWKIVDDCIVHPPDIWQCEYSDDLRREVFSVPSGSVELIYKFDPVSASYYPEKHPVTSLEDIKIMTEWFSAVKPFLDSERLENAMKDIDSVKTENRQISCTCSGASPFLYYVVHLAGIENAHILFWEHPEEVQSLLDAAFEYIKARFTLHLETLRPDVFMLIENMSTMLVSPVQFRDYVLPHMKILKQVCDSGGGTLALQMPGHISAILEFLAELDDVTVEGICSPPVGDTTLEMARKACPELRVAGGTNAALWLESSESIIKQLQTELDSMPHHRGVAVTSSDMIPPDTPLKTIFEVAEFVENYPVQ